MREDQKALLNERTPSHELFARICALRVEGMSFADALTKGLADLGWTYRFIPELRRCGWRPAGK